MSGYRSRIATVQKNFVRVEGTLKLPLDFSNSVDDGIQGVFPELFYGFYNTSGVGMDIGVMCRGNSGWKVFCYGDIVEGHGWSQEVPIHLSKGQIITIGAQVGANDTMICTVNGKSYNFKLNPGKGKLLSGGCQINREMNLVPQSYTGCTLLKTNAYFKDAQWSHTDLYTVDGTKLKMGSAMTVYEENPDYGEVNYDTSCIVHSAVADSSYVKDIVTIDFRLRQICK